MQMSKRKRDQGKQFSKITKKKNQDGQVQQLVASKKDYQITQPLSNEKQQNVFPEEEQFEDQFDDQFQKQEGWVSAEDDSEEDSQQKQIMKMEEEARDKDIISYKKKQKLNFQGEAMKEEQTEQDKKKSAFMGSNKQLKKGEVLDFDNSAYDMLHRLNIEWPSLSIDFVHKSSPFDSFSGFQEMSKYPYEVYTVQGSSNNTKNNYVYLTKMARLHRTKFDDEPEAEEEGDNQSDQPQIFYQQAITNYDINRIRSLNGSPVVAFWNDCGSKGGEVHLMDMTANFQKLKNNVSSKKPELVKEIIIPFECSGYGINWNPNKIGQLAVGDQKGRISILTNNENYTSWTTQTTYTYHKSSVEDIFFSPDQDYVFASCSSDGTLQIVDMRVNETKKSQIKIDAHSSDVNVGDWNTIAKHLIVTGGDDAMVKVWDLRMCKGKNSEQLLCFNWHTEPITSIEFQPNEESVVAVASEDNRLTIWDMSVQNQEEDPEVPNQLMFLHQGQEQIKQIRYHPVYYEMLISSSLDSINLFKPSFEMPEEAQQEIHDKQDLRRPPMKEQDLDKFLGRMSLQ